MKTLTRIFVLGLLAALSGCATVAVATNKDKDYHDQLSKVAVFVDTSSLKLSVKDEEATAAQNTTLKKTNGGTIADVMKTVPLSDYLADNVAKRLVTLGLDAQPFKNDTLALGNDVDQRIAAYKPVQILVLRLKDATVYANDQLYTGNFEAVVVDYVQNKNVWKASIGLKDASGYGVGTTGYVQLIDKLFKALEKDELIQRLTPVKAAY